MVVLDRRNRVNFATLANPTDANHLYTLLQLLRNVQDWINYKLQAFAMSTLSDGTECTERFAELQLSTLTLNGASQSTIVGLAC